MNDALEYVICVQCTKEVAQADALFDDRAHHFYCDRGCFSDWADDHFEEIAEFYESLNVT